MILAPGTDSAGPRTPTGAGCRPRPGPGCGPARGVQRRIRPRAVAAATADGTGVHAQLGVDVDEVGLDGRLAEEELFADRRVRQAVGDELEDLGLPAGERGGGGAHPVHEAQRDGGARADFPAAAVRTAAASSSGGASLRR